MNTDPDLLYAFSLIQRRNNYYLFEKEVFQNDESHGCTTGFRLQHII